MERNYYSKSAKLYRYFYSNKEMPKNFYKYNIKLLLMWIFFIPAHIFVLPGMIIETLVYLYCMVRGNASISDWEGIDYKYSWFLSWFVYAVVLIPWSGTLCIMNLFFGFHAINLFNIIMMAFGYIIDFTAVLLTLSMLPYILEFLKKEINKATPNINWKW